MEIKNKSVVFLKMLSSRVTSVDGLEKLERFKFLILKLEHLRKGIPGTLAECEKQE